MSEGLIAELAIEDPGGCPVAGTARAVGEPASDVAKTLGAEDEAAVVEEFTLPASADVAGEGADRVALADGDHLGTHPQRIASFEDRDVYRFSRTTVGTCVCDRLEPIVGPVANVRAREGSLVVTIHAENIETVRDAIEELQSAFEGVRTRKLTQSSGEGGDDLVLVDRADLTRRQREVLSMAHEMGYFEYPKGANAGEVAEALSIAHSTFAEHLAAAQRKIMAAVLER